MPLNFDLVATNPNDSTGGGGSLAGPMRDEDARGPYFVWPNTEMESGISPFAVVAASEVRAMAKALDDLDAGLIEALAGGERETYALAVTGETGHGRGDESPEYDLSDARSAEDFSRAFARRD